MRLVDNWRCVARKAWSVRIALLWAALNAFYAAWPAFMDHVNPFLFAGLNVLMGVSVAGARVTHQPGANL